MRSRVDAFIPFRQSLSHPFANQHWQRHHVDAWRRHCVFIRPEIYRRLLWEQSERRGGGGGSNLFHMWVGPSGMYDWDVKEATGVV